ncbi:hypothetical protein ADEAN_000740700 [Angomonas deanei]|uniref:Surface antigen-like protein n=1 Tax=Angomonas deanei TaxID=59799 RepID=A0A7G2CLU7_9TRYP|nr:hypothetical protein ADEAN_000740700 [Angomonas deanei]
MPSLRSLAVLLVLLTLHSVSAFYCIFPCQTCKDEQCATCVTGYHMDNDTKHCVPDCHLTSCRSCGAPNICILCEVGYYVNAEAGCTSKVSEASSTTQWIVLVAAVITALSAYVA